MNVRAVIWGLCLIVMGVLTFWQINAQNAKIDGDILSPDWHHAAKDPVQ